MVYPLPMKLMHRVQEWLAEHTDFVQYPAQRVEVIHPEQSMKGADYALKRILYGLFFLVVIIIGFIILGISGMALYSLFT